MSTFETRSFRNASHSDVAKEIDRSMAEARTHEFSSRYYQLDSTGIYVKPQWKTDQDFNIETDLSVTNLRSFGTASGPDFSIGPGFYLASQVSNGRGLMYRSTDLGDTQIRSWGDADA